MPPKLGSHFFTYHDEFFSIIQESPNVVSLHPSKSMHSCKRYYKVLKNNNTDYPYILKPTGNVIGANTGALNSISKLEITRHGKNDFYGRINNSEKVLIILY